MRLDKFLWCVRYFKTRSLATKVCRGGRVKVNGETAKPSREVYPGDTIAVRKNQINYKVEILDIPKSRRGAKWVKLYIMDITPQENLKKQELLKYERTEERKKGTGRPTKKDRRELEDWYTQKREEWFDDE